MVDAIIPGTIVAQYPATIKFAGHYFEDRPTQNLVILYIYIWGNLTNWGPLITRVALTIHDSLHDPPRKNIIHTHLTTITRTPREILFHAVPVGFGAHFGATVGETCAIRTSCDLIAVERSRVEDCEHRIQGKFTELV